jgi:hypothetical protein
MLLGGMDVRLPGPMAALALDAHAHVGEIEGVLSVQNSGRVTVEAGEKE